VKHEILRALSNIDLTCGTSNDRALIYISSQEGRAGRKAEKPKSRKAGASENKFQVIRVISRKDAYVAGEAFCSLLVIFHLGALVDSIFSSNCPLVGLENKKGNVKTRRENHLSDIPVSLCGEFLNSPHECQLAGRFFFLLSDLRGIRSVLARLKYPRCSRSHGSKSY